MFAKVYVMLNWKTVCYRNYHYAHRSYIETILNFVTDMKKRELTAALWHEDTACHFEDLAYKNVGFATRRQLSMTRRTSGFIYTATNYN